MKRKHVAREIWTEAKRRLTERYIKANPGTDWARAAAIISDRHEEIGAEMDAMERHWASSEGAGA